MVFHNLHGQLVSVFDNTYFRNVFLYLNQVYYIFGVQPFSLNLSVDTERSPALLS